MRHMSAMRMQVSRCLSIKAPCMHAAIITVQNGLQQQ